MGVLGTKTGAARLADKVDGPFEAGAEADLVNHQQSIQLPMTVALDAGMNATD